MAATVSTLGDEILVNSATVGDQGLPRIAALANGGFVVTWIDGSQGAGGATGDPEFAAVKAQVFAPDGTREGAELLVNTATTGAQIEPEITALASGGFAVTWRDFSQGVGGATGDSSESAVKAQMFAADGTRVGAELLVNTATAGTQGAPLIRALSSGGFVVTWHDFSHGVGGAGGDSSSAALKAQVFAVDGTRVGTELLVNTATADSQELQQITALPNGGFVVTWSDFSAGVGGATGDSSGGAVKAQVFAADSTRVGAELLVNTATAGTQRAPQITALSNSAFVITWDDLSAGVGGAAGDSSDAAAKAQVFAADGTRVGAELLVNSATEGDQGRPQITALSNGGFVITWEDSSEGVGGAAGDTSSSALKAQLFAADGTRIGAELLVNTATASGQVDVEISALPNGGFAVIWQDLSQGIGGATGDSDDGAIKAQVFAPDGTRVGAELLVNTATSGNQAFPLVAALANGGFVVTWQDFGQGVGGAPWDTDGGAVKAQVFSVTDPSISGDGGPNLLIGTALGETIQGLGGTDTLIGGLGDDTLDGGADDDTTFFSGNLADYTLQDLGSRITVAGPDGNDTLFGIEHLQFADGTIDVSDGSGLFDSVFYLRNNLDVFHAGVNALDHFNTFGFREGRDPNAFFDTSGYLAVNRDVAASGINPLDHFHQIGWKQGRDPSANFDTTLYLINNPDVAVAGIDPLEHFLRFGFLEGRQAFAAIGQNIVGGFDAQFYLFHNPDVAAAGVDPLVHYNAVGRFEGRNPNAWFDTAGYLSHYTDVAAAGVNPLQHYETVGWTEGRDPSAGFDTLGYLAANPDVAAAHVNPLDHFLQFGIYEGRTAVNDGIFH